MAVHTTADKKTIGRGGFPSVGPKVGLIQAEVDLTTLLTTGDSAQVFAIPAGTQILCAGIEVVTASTGAATVDLGSAQGGVQYASALACNGTVGTKLSGGYDVSNVVSSAASIMYASLRAAVAGTPGVIRVWAVIVDINDMA